MTSVRSFGDAALLVEVADAEAAQALRRDLVARPLPGVIALVPGRASLLVEIDPLRGDPDQLAAPVLERAARVAVQSTAPGRRRVIPVRYGGEAGPDLAAVAEALGLTPGEVVAAHAEAEHRVLFCGFAPGFAYLGGVPSDWRIPRLATPRTRTPAGAIGVADGMTGIYPAELPGGWPIIGRTPRALFDATRSRPSYLEPGDRVRFVSIGEEEWARFAGPAPDW